MVCNDYCYDVDMWCTFFYCNFTLDLYSSTLLIKSCKKQVACICVIFDLVCSWTLVENVVARRGFSTNDTREQKKSNLVLESRIQELDDDIENPKCKKVKLTYTMAH
jgi:hypothetical protein